MPVETFTSPTEWTAPSGITKIIIRCYGQKGEDFTWTDNGGYSNKVEGGYGGYVKGVLPVNSGETLHIDFTSGGNGTYANGGDAADVRYGGTSLSDRIIVGAGGGGTSSKGDYVGPIRGGAGGAKTGESPADFDSNDGADSGHGGTQTSGGQGGAKYGGSDGEDGSFGIGGDGGIGGYDEDVAAGGGAGWYGGGGGGGGDRYAPGGAGGGGSNYVDDSLTNTVSQRGQNDSNSYVEIEYEYSGPSTLVSGDWQSHQLNRYDGSSWSTHLLKRYDGNNWNSI